MRFCSPAAEKYYLHLLIQILIWSFIYTGWSLMGRFGLTSLGHGAFTGIGAYVMVLLWNYCGHDAVDRHPGRASLLSVMVALLVGYPCFHLRIIGHYFALLTLALTEFVRLCIVGLRDYTGGSLGTQPARYGDGVSLYALQFEPDRVLSYYVALALWAVGPLHLEAGRPQHGPLRARCREPGRGRGRFGRHRRDAREAEDHRDLGRDVRGRRRDLRAVPDVYRAGHDRGARRLAQHRVRRDRRRHVGDARADGRRGVHAGAVRSAARHDPELGDVADDLRLGACSRSTR